MRKTLLAGLITCSLATSYAQVKSPSTTSGNITVFLASRTGVPTSSNHMVSSGVIGIDQVSISYYSPSLTSPALKGKSVSKDIFQKDELVMVGDNTPAVLNLSHEGYVNGKLLKAGSYALWLENKNSTMGVTLYSDLKLTDPTKMETAKIAATFDANPLPATEQSNNLTFDIAQLSLTTGQVDLEWGDLKLPLSIRFDNDQRIMANLQKTLAKNPTWDMYLEAVQYCLTSNSHLDKALVWADQSIKLNKNTNNIHKKSEVLGKLNRLDEAASNMDAAIAMSPRSRGNDTSSERAILEQIKQGFLNAKKK